MYTQHQGYRCKHIKALGVTDEERKEKRRRETEGEERGREGGREREGSEGRREEERGR